MAKPSPTQRTLRELRREGRIVDTAERWVINPKHPAGGFRKDLFGFIDLVVLDAEKGIVGIQSCGQSFKAHLDKIKDSECTQYVIEWLKAGICKKEHPYGITKRQCQNQMTHIEVWGWRKVKLKRGGKAMRWRARVADVYLTDTDQVEHKEYK